MLLYKFRATLLDSELYLEKPQYFLCFFIDEKNKSIYIESKEANWLLLSIL